MNNLIEALQILIKYQIKDKTFRIHCEYEDLIVYIDDIADVTNVDFRRLAKLGFIAGIDDDVPSDEHESEIFQACLGVLYDDEQIDYLKSHCSDAFHCFE